MGLSGTEMLVKNLLAKLGINPEDLVKGFESFQDTAREIAASLKEGLDNDRLILGNQALILDKLNQLGTLNGNDGVRAVSQDVDALLDHMRETAGSPDPLALGDGNSEDPGELEPGELDKFSEAVNITP